MGFWVIIFFLFFRILFLQFKRTRDFLWGWGKEYIYIQQHFPHGFSENSALRFTGPGWGFQSLPYSTSEVLFLLFYSVWVFSLFSFWGVLFVCLVFPQRSKMPFRIPSLAHKPLSVARFTSCRKFRHSSHFHGQFHWTVLLPYDGKTETSPLNRPARGPQVVAPHSLPGSGGLTVAGLGRNVKSAPEILLGKRGHPCFPRK